MPTPKRKTYRLTFVDAPDYEGIVVTMTGLSVGELIDTLTAPEKPTAITLKVIEEYRRAVTRIYDIFTAHLVGWNVTDHDNQPVPATLAGVMTQDETFILDIIKVWRSATQEIPDPLGQPSNGGVPSPGLSLPMEISSPNPQS